VGPDIMSGKGLIVLFFELGPAIFLQLLRHISSLREKISLPVIFLDFAVARMIVLSFLQSISGGDMIIFKLEALKIL
jgi:hypothetical protein